MDLDTIIKNCEKYLYFAVELRTGHKHGVEPSISKDERAKVKAKFVDRGVKLLSLGSTCEFHSAKAEVVKQNIESCAQFVELAHDIGADGVKVRPNGLNVKMGIPADDTLKQIGHALQECGKQAETFGIQ